MEFTGERYVPGVGGSIALEHEHRYRFCLDIVSGSRVLDIACGEGFGSAMMALRATKVWGVDIDPEAIIHALRSYKNENLHFTVGSCTSIPLPDDSVDVVVSFETIEHHDAHDEMIDEIKRVLRPGGALVISSPDKRVYSEVRNFNNAFHVKELYSHEFEQLLENNFKHVSLFGQKIVFGSGIFPQNIRGEIKSYAIDSTSPVPGIPEPVYQIAIASDNPDWISKGYGGILEETIYRSEALIEHALAATKEADEQKKKNDELRNEIDKIAESVDAVARDRDQSILQMEKLKELADVYYKKSENLQRQRKEDLESFREIYEEISIDRNASRLRAGEAAHLQLTYNKSLDSAARSLELTANNSVALAEKLSHEVHLLSRYYYSARLWKRLAFHRRGRPRGWLRSFLLKDKFGTPRSRLANRAIFKKNGSIRPIFRDWYLPLSEKSLDLHIKGKPTSDSIIDGAKSKDETYNRFINDVIASGALREAKTVHIVTTHHTKFVGALIIDALKSTRLSPTTSFEMPPVFDHDLYIIVAPQMFSSFPPGASTIFVQMEQVRASNWANEAYMDRLMNSICVLDYSQDNIAALIDRGLPLSKIYYFPIHPLMSRNNWADKRDIDVLFYGAINSSRREQYLSELAKRVNLRVETDTFGDELSALLDRTKVVVNIHFYEAALLETTRISEALSHGAHVVSEDSEDQKHRRGYESRVSFVPRDDINAFVDRVEAALLNWSGPFMETVEENFDGSAYHLLRALNGCGVISPDELYSSCMQKGLCLSSSRLVLALPEQVERYNFAQANMLPESTIFPGLRHIDGWKGCALSYKFMARLALEKGISSLMIYEDDATFDPEANFRLKNVLNYLSGIEGEWDLFSGLITDLHADASITKVDSLGIDTFIHLDSVIGMVFGIYSTSALQMLADFEIEGEDTSKHTIDRYLEAIELRCVTTLIPIAHHNESLDSTLWSVKNSAVSGMIANSINRLLSKKKAFLSSGSAREVSESILQS